MTHQASILPGSPRVARYLSFSLGSDISPEASRTLVQELEVDESITVGIGQPLVRFWGAQLGGLRTFPSLSGPGVQVPSEQHALWMWLRGDDQGELVHRGNGLIESLAAGFHPEQVTDTFKYGSEELGKDLTGYEDGTENPTGDEAVAAAILAGDEAGMAGSSFVAVQQWIHDLEMFTALPQSEQDNIIGRRKSDNSEIGDAPESAHVKRAEQESFTPEAIVLRRSMPFTQSYGDGLMFVAFGKSLDAFEVQMRRMAGLEDGIADALFRFSRPVNGAYYWCPPVAGDRLDLSAVS